MEALEFVKWSKLALALISFFGVLLGIFSSTSPDRSIKLYQWIMRNFNWKVEPIHYERELRNTRVLGGLMALVSALIILALFRPDWFLLGRL